MTGTTSDLHTRREPRINPRIRRLALVAGSILGAIGARWNDFVESGQLGPATEQSVSRHTGART